LVDAKSREAIAGLGSMSEARQLLFASLLLADQLVDERPPIAAPLDPRLTQSAERLAMRLESLADTLESEAPSA
jgi:cell division protein ZapA